MDEGVLLEEQLDGYTTTSKLCPVEGSEVSDDETFLQG